MQIDLILIVRSFFRNNYFNFVRVEYSSSTSGSEYTERYILGGGYSVVFAFFSA